MNFTGEKLKEEIERKKMEMILIAEKKGTTSSQTLNCSQELDKLIYKFQKLSIII
jgi:Spo0E like sporulation regulatory protein